MKEEEKHAVVYDLDGTLVELEVNWREVRDAVAQELRENSVDPKDASLWDMLDIGERNGLTREVEKVISEYECEGARSSKRLTSSDLVSNDSRKLGVCSLNSEESCKVALETHELTEYIDAVVGRDSVERRKPDPEPLIETIERLGEEPQNSVFVGDSKRDLMAAERADVQFVYVDEWLETF